MSDIAEKAVTCPTCGERMKRQGQGKLVVADEAAHPLPDVTYECPNGHTVRIQDPSGD